MPSTELDWDLSGPVERLTDLLHSNGDNAPQLIDVDIDDATGTRKEFMEGENRSVQGSRKRFGIGQCYANLFVGKTHGGTNST